jgi:hypothetical protein
MRKTLRTSTVINELAKLREKGLRSGAVSLSKLDTLIWNIAFHHDIDCVQFQTTVRKKQDDYREDQ